MKTKHIIGQQNPIIEVFTPKGKSIKLKGKNSYILLMDLDNKTYTAIPLWLFNLKNYPYSLKGKLHRLIIFLSNAWEDEKVRLRNLKDYNKE